MADPELEAIRKRRMQEIMVQHGMEVNKTLNNRRLRRMLRGPSLNIARIALTKPEKARGVEDVILRAAQMGQITEKVSEERLVSLLEQINNQTTNRQKLQYKGVAVFLMMMISCCYEIPSNGILWVLT